MSEINEKDLVMIRMNNNPNYEGRQKHYNTWFKVMFIDNDGSFIGRVERIDKQSFTLYKKGEDVRLETHKVQDVYKEGQQWCYSDNITTCNCPGVCRNK